MSKATTLAQARAAKEKVAAIVKGDPSVNGIGIARIGRGYGVKLNLSDATAVADRLPREIDGVPLKVERVGPIRKRTR